MDQELKELKSVLRSIVVSSPTQVDVRSLLRDYRAMMGGPLPLAKYGYRDALSFLKERFSDCFLFTGPINDPLLTLIVPETLKHIDKFVQSQKLSSTVKFKGKRRSIPEKSLVEKNTIATTFRPVTKKYLPPDNINKKDSIKNGQTKNINEVNKNSSPATHTKTSPMNRPFAKLDINDKENNVINRITNVNKSDNGSCSSDAVQNFLKKRLPAYDSAQYLTNEKFNDDKLSFKDDDDSGRQTSSSNSIVKAAKLEELKIQIRDLVAEHPEGVWCTDLIKLYKQHYGRELNYARFGFTSVLSLVCVMDELSVSRPSDTGDWIISVSGSAPAPTPDPAFAPIRRFQRATRPISPTPDVEDALPGIEFDADVFPADCMSLGEGVAQASVSGVAVGALLEVMVGEVYSPSHFWLIRRGPAHHIAMENIMDKMDEYYKWGEGKDRELTLGAVRVGHYCAAVYEGAWHRCVIVRLLDSDTVKVRHVDYGTVDVVNTRGLRPLLAVWGGLEAQAVRARLAGVRPAAAGRRWPRAAAAAFLQRVRDMALVAQVAAVNHEENVLEVYLIDTTTEDDVCIGSELVRAGHADVRHDSAVRASDHYLYPLFEALENGDTPNYAEIYAYLRDGIALEYVDDYRRHVPCWPERCSDSSAPANSPEPHSPAPNSPAPNSPAPNSPAPKSPAPNSPAPKSPARTDSPEPCPPPNLIDLSVTEPQPTPTVLPTPAPSPAPVPAPAPAPPSRASVTSYRVPNQLPVQPPPYPPYPPYAAYPGPMPMYPAMFPGSMPVMMGPPPGLGPVPGYPAPRPSPNPGSRDAVTLSVSECEIYRLLCRVDPAAAHWYMEDAISRRLSCPAPSPSPSPSRLNPEAAEFRAEAAEVRAEAAEVRAEAAELRRVAASTQTLWRPRRRAARDDSSD